MAHESIKNGECGPRSEKVENPWIIAFRSSEGYWRDGMKLEQTVWPDTWQDDGCYCHCASIGSFFIRIKVLSIFWAAYLYLRSKGHFCSHYSLWIQTIITLQKHYTELDSVYSIACSASHIRLCCALSLLVLFDLLFLWPFTNFWLVFFFCRKETGSALRLCPQL